MGKTAKEHRKKVNKRNSNLKSKELIMKKLWQESFQEQMEKMKQKFENEETLDKINNKLDVLGENIDNINDNNLANIQSNLKEIADILKIDLNDQNEQEETTQEGSESVESVQGE